MKTSLNSWYKEKAKLNIVIDTIMLILMMAVAGLGFLIKFVLLPGFKTKAMYGQNIELTFLNLDRHQWGSIHLLLSIILVSLIILHIILHWNMIVCIYKKLFPKRPVRVIFSTGIIFTGIFFAVSPFLVEPSQQILEPGYRQRLSQSNISGINHMETTGQPIELPANQQTGKKNSGNGEAAIASPPKKSHEKKPKLRKNEHKDFEVDIDGKMTLDQACDKYNVSIASVAAEIGVPVSKSEYRLGWLRKRYQFQMNDVRAVIESLREKANS